MSAQIIHARTELPVLILAEVIAVIVNLDIQGATAKQVITLSASTRTEKLKGWFHCSAYGHKMTQPSGGYLGPPT